MRRFLEPESVALIGVPRHTGTGAYNNLEMLLRFGYQGKIYPVNPKASEICGIRCYPSILEVPEAVHLAVITVARDRVPQVFDQCCEKGISRIVIISQGFADGDEKGKRLQEELSQKAKERKVRVLGPNTIGVYNVHHSFTTGFVDHHKPVSPDPVCMVAQTGAYQVGATVFSPNGFAKAIDLGNACDVDIVDALEYLETDTQTKVIAVHMEGIKRGRAFIEVARKVGRKKPVIILKTGRSSAGRKAALSHTGSLVGDAEIFEAAFRKARVIQVKTNSELQDAIRAFINFPPMNGPRIAVITATGAVGVMATDACEAYGLELGPVPRGLSEQILTDLPDWVNLGNPIDIWPIGMISGKMPQVFESALVGALDSEHIDGVAIVWLSYRSPLHKDMDFSGVTDRAQRERNAKKPIAFWIYGDDVSRAVEKYEAIPGVACFPTIERAIRGLSFNHQYSELRRKPLGKGIEVDVDRSIVSGIVEKGKKEKILVGKSAFLLLDALGIPVVPYELANTLDEALEAAWRVGYPVVCKISSAKLLHKTESKVVELNISSEEKLKEVYARFMNIIGGLSDSAAHILIQKQLAGHELLLGLKHDPHFGMILVCGQGGVYTEVYKDIAQTITPVSLDEAQEMLQSLKIYPILKGVRGEKGVDIGLLISMICRLSFLAEEGDGLREADVNPLIVNEDGCWAVDARFVWE